MIFVSVPSRPTSCLKTGLDANGLFILFKKLFEEISMRGHSFLDMSATVCLQSPLSMVLSLSRIPCFDPVVCGITGNISS